MDLLQFMSIGVITLTAATSMGVAPAMAQMPFPSAADTPGLSAALSAAPPYKCVTNRYVDGVNGNDSNPGTQALPWKTIGNADNGWPNSPVAGECVNVLPGTYAITASIGIGPGQTGTSNSATGYIVYRSTVPQGAHIVPGAGFQNYWDMIYVNAGYVLIDGFEIDGKGATSGSGINGCAGGGANNNIAHHFVAINNLIHDVGGSGISSCTADFIIWRNNVVHNTTASNPYQMSALNVFEPKALPAGSYTPGPWDTVQFGIQIAYNISHDNSEGPAINYAHTDGNGIIIDTTFGSSTCPTCGTPYPGAIMVLGNLVYNNGGGGIHVLWSENVTVANNTVYNDYLDPANTVRARGELTNLGSANITWVNNIAIAVPGTGIFANNKPIISIPLGGGFTDSGTFERNITFGASNISDSTSKVSSSTNLVGVNPKLTSPATGNFTPLPGSPAKRTGVPETYLPTSTPDIGAF